MSTANATLNADGSITFYTENPSSLGPLLTLNTSSPANTSGLEAVIANVVEHNLWNTATLSAEDVVCANLAVQNGLISATQLTTWASNNDIQVTDIYTSTPTQGGATITEALTTAVNDPLVTSNGSAPTLTQATAQAAITSQAAAEPATGPAAIAGVSTAAEQVQAAYVAFYGRPADPSGLAYWQGQLTAAGGNLNSIINSFGSSAESQALYGGQSVTQEVTSIYQQELNRAPDSAGLSYWVQQISSGAVSSAAAALAIFNGATGSDQTTINNKLVVAEAFTNALTSDSTANALYAGTAAAANARTYLSTVNTSSTMTVSLAGIADQVGHAIQNATSVTSDLTSVGATATAAVAVQLVGVHTATIAHAAILG